MVLGNLRVFAEQRIGVQKRLFFKKNLEKSSENIFSDSWAVRK